MLLCPYYPHIVISVPHKIPLLLFLWLYIIIVTSAGLYCDSLDSYIERRFCHLYHPRIVDLCNVIEVAPSKRLNSKAWIYLFYLFLSWFHNKINTNESIKAYEKFIAATITWNERGNLNIMEFNGEVTHCSTWKLESPLFHLYLERCKSGSHTVSEITCSFFFRIQNLF